MPDPNKAATDNTKVPDGKAADSSAAAATQQAATQQATATPEQAEAGKQAAATQQTADQKKADENKSLLGDDEAGTETKKEEGKQEEKKDEAKDAVPEKYEFKVPEGMQVDPRALEAITPVLKDLKLTQAQAQKLFDAQASLKKEEVVQSEMALLTQRKTWREGIKQNPKWQEELSLSKRGLQLGTPAFQNMIKNSWMGDHPDVIKYLADVGRMAGDDRFVEGSKGGREPLTQAEKVYGKKKS